MSKLASSLEASQLERLLELLIALYTKLEEEYQALHKPLFPKSLYEQYFNEQRRNRLIKDLRDISILQTTLKTIIRKKLCA